MTQRKIDFLTLVMAAGFLFFLALPAGAENIDLLDGSTGAVCQGMGQTGVAFPQGIFSPSWNPAGALLTRPAVGSHYTSLFSGDVARYALLAGWPAGGLNFSLGYIRETISSIPLTTVGEDGRPVYQGNFSDLKTCLSLTVAEALLDESLYWGVTLKDLRHEVYSQKANTQGIDLGFLYWPEAGDFSAGLTFTNILQPKFLWGSAHQDALTRKLTLGTGLRFNLFSFPAKAALDLVYQKGNRLGLRGGLEVLLIKELAARLGTNEAGITLGLGIGWKNLHLDYSYQSHPDLGASQQVSLRLDL